MRILYGVVGEGMGHAMRSRVILDELTKTHEVQVVVSGRAHDYLQKHLGEAATVRKIWGFTIVTEDNEVRSFKTVLENVKGAFTGGWPRNVKTYFELAEQFRPEIVISDFETWSYLFARNWRLPVISIDNMQIINRCAHAPEITAGVEREFQLAKALVKAKVPGAYHYFVTTFFRPPIRKPRTSLHPPILRPEILAAKSEPGDHLLVYQTNTTNQELPEILKRSGLPCRVYGMRRDLKEPLRDGDLTYMPFSEQGFIDDLRTARGVVASAGFTLMGEAVYLHKPMLAEPVGGQFEQVLNARYLEQLGYGLSAEPLTESRLKKFIELLPDFEASLASYRQDGNRDLLSRLDETLALAAEGRDANDDEVSLP